MAEDIDLSNLDEELQNELEILKEIFIKEIQLFDKGDKIEIKVSLTPSTGDRWDEKFVFLDLIIVISKTEYPNTKCPEFRLSKVRGISQDHQSRILHELCELASLRLGEHVLYDLIEHVQETLTQNNMPAGNCPICLESFSGYCHFTITECTHYFHMACLNEHLKHLDKTEDGYSEPRCPSCREILDDDYVEALERNTTELGLKCNLHKARAAKPVPNPLQEKDGSDEGLIISFSNLMDAPPTDPNNLSQDKLGSTCSTVPSNIEDSQSELSVSLSHQSEISTSHDLSHDSVPLPEKDDLCYTDEEEEVVNEKEKDKTESGSEALTTQLSDEDNSTEDFPEVTSEYVSFTKEAKIVNIEEETPEQISALKTEEEKDMEKVKEDAEEIKEELKEEAAKVEHLPIEGEKEIISVEEDPATVLVPDDSPADLCSAGEGDKTPTEESVQEVKEEDSVQPAPVTNTVIEDLEKPAENSAEVVSEEVTEATIVADLPKQDDPAEPAGEISKIKSDVPKQNGDPSETVEDISNTEEEKKENEAPKGENEDLNEDDVFKTEEVMAKVEDKTPETVEESLKTEDDTSKAEDEEEDEDVSEVTEVSVQKSVSFSEDPNAKSTGCREIQTQTRRVKRNRNRRRNNNNRDGNFREGDGGSRGGRGSNHHHGQRGGYHHPPQQDGEVVYRRADRGRGNRENCRSYHEGVEHNRNKQEYRRHSFSEHSQNWRENPQQGNKRYHGPRDQYYPPQPPQQPRFKPPRILRQEALAQAKKLSQALNNQELSNNMHKIPVSLYNPGGAAGAPQLGSFPPVFPGFQMTQIPPHMYQAANNYHQQHAARKQHHSSDPRPDPRVADPRAERPQPTRPTDLSGPLSQATNLPKTGVPQQSKAISPTSHNKIFDVSRFQQSILRNNTSPTSTAGPTK